MADSERLQETATLSVSNIGGIDGTTVGLQPEINVLSGRNATNRTSLLQAIMAACGSRAVSIKADAAEATVTMTLGQEQYERTLTRQNGGIAYDGSPYLDDPELADLFAFLLESNECRRAIRDGRDLRDLIMRPVDLDELHAEIASLEAKKSDIDERIDEIERRKRSLPELESRRTELDSEIEALRQTLAETEAAIDDADRDLGATRQQKEELEETLAMLRDARDDLETVRYDIDTERETIESLKQDRSDLHAELSDLPETADERLSQLDRDIEQLREQKRRLDSEINSLQSTIRFNEEMLDGRRTDVYEAMADHSGTADQLLGEELVCWTCGSEVSRQEIETTVAELRDLREQKLDAKRSVTADLDELKTERKQLEQQRDRREDCENRLAEIEQELTDRRQRLEERREKRTELEASVEELESAVEELESGSVDRILELHREANQLEYELGSLETEREDVESEIDSIESDLAELDELETKRERLSEELTEHRTRIETLEKEAIDAFNEHMAELLDVLDYDNLDRIWIERVQTVNGRQSEETVFELHVVRSTPSGTTYEDTVEHLSESEREVTGLVFALAGYLVHDVHETVPFILLDSLEAIDSHRIATLIDYFGDFTDYLVVALLEEDAAAIDCDHHRIESI